MHVLNPCMSICKEKKKEKQLESFTFSALICRHAGHLSSFPPIPYLFWDYCFCAKSRSLLVCSNRSLLANQCYVMVSSRKIKVGHSIIYLRAYNKQRWWHLKRVVSCFKLIYRKDCFCCVTVVLWFVFSNFNTFSQYDFISKILCKY